MARRDVKLLVIEKDEAYPVYAIKAKIAGYHTEPPADISEELRRRYDQALKAWEDVQQELEKAYEDAELTRLKITPSRPVGRQTPLDVPPPTPDDLVKP